MTLFQIGALMFALGGLFGGVRAVRRKGNILDVLQYGFAHAVAFGVGTIVLILMIDLFF